MGGSEGSLNQDSLQKFWVGIKRFAPDCFPIDLGCYTLAMNSTTRRNRQTWDQVSDLFVNSSCLPIWGPFSVGQDLKLIPEIEGKTFLEIACGSGRSLRYVLDRRASKAYGLDFSEMQLAEAARFNSEYIQAGKLQLIRSAMEERIDIEPVDVVFSIYGIGWTDDPKKTFSNVASYLKPGGLFIWSWEHSIFADVAWDDGQYVVVRSYHDEGPVTIKDWMKQGCDVSLTHRRSSTWFSLLREAGLDVDGYFEPAPIDAKYGHDHAAEYYSIQKARVIPSSFIFVCRKK
jgi:SAM-dependent methyltransferase